MVIYLQSIVCDALPLLLLVSFVSICITRATSTLSLINDDNRHGNRIKRADEYVMTSATVDGLKRSNICGEGYLIEGALLKSSPYSKSQSYSPNEDCYMTFKTRRSDYQIRIRILSLDLNDIHGGVNCLDSLRFYKSVYITGKDKLNSVECGQLNEKQNFNIVSPTGIVTAHFSTDGGNVSGLGFKVVLTAFRFPNKTHPCESTNDEYLCSSRECISSLLKCDGVPHCLDGSDEPPYRSCSSSAAGPSNTDEMDMRNQLAISKRQNWRGVVIAAFLLIISVVFVLFTVYFVCRRCINPNASMDDGERRSYASIFTLRKNRSKTPPASQVIVRNDKSSKRLDEDYNLL